MYFALQPSSLTMTFSFLKYSYICFFLAYRCISSLNVKPCCVCTPHSLKPMHDSVSIPISGLSSDLFVAHVLKLGSGGPAYNRALLAESHTVYPMLLVNRGTLSSDPSYRNRNFFPRPSRPSFSADGVIAESIFPCRLLMPALSLRLGGGPTY